MTDLEAVEFWVVGWLVVLMLLLSGCQGHPVPQADPAIIPGKSAAGISLGDTFDTVLVKLGNPDAMRYYDQGDQVRSSSASWNSVLAVDLDHADVIVTVIMTSGFPGKTAEGVGIGTSRAAVHRVYGKPDSIIRWDDYYHELGISFSFSPLVGCDLIRVHRPIK